MVLAQTRIMIETFHFLRPWMLLLLIPAGLFLLVQYQRKQWYNSWQSVVDRQLLAFQLNGQNRTTRKWTALSMLVVALLIIIALAGPVWEQRPVPVYRDQLARVIVLDVSRSMDAADVESSRIARARFKVRDILARSHNIQVGLIAFAAAPYVISPLTDDTRTINAMVPSLSTSIVPVQGSDLAAALREAVALMRGAGVDSGQVILLTDAKAGVADFEAAADLRSLGYSLSVLAVGSEQGAPIPDQGGFMKDSSGNIVIPGVAMERLRKLAELGGGEFSRLSADETDITPILDATDRLASSRRRAGDNTLADSWIERGPWFLLPLIPCVAILFRRGIN
jgi:Ca-activated chloride channel family protein